MIKPENSVAGNILRMDVAANAAICVRVNADMNKPIPVVVVTYSNAANVKVKKLPCKGTLKINSAIASITK